MQKSSQKTSKWKEKGKADLFVWSDDDVELLLKVTHEYNISVGCKRLIKLEIRLDRRHVYATLWPSVLDPNIT